MPPSLPQGAEPRFAVRRFTALGTTAFVVTERDDAIDIAHALLRQEVAAIDLACSRFRPDSEIARVHRAAGRPVLVSELLAQAVEVALRAAAQTEGAVDPTVGASLVALGYDADFAQLDDDRPFRPSRLRAARGWRCIELDARSRILRVPEGVLLDLGATAKAYAADRAAARIAEVTGSAVLVNLGGDIAVQGCPAHGWAVGLALDCASDPRDAQVVVSIRQGGLASSGTSVRAWRSGGRRVHHIIDPRTGDSAATCWELVSVAAPTCVEANAHSTAALVWGDAALGRLAARGLPCRLLHDSGAVTTMHGWPADRRRVDAAVA